MAFFDLKFLVMLIWGSAILLNLASNPVVSALYLILTFVLSSLLLFNLGLILISYIYVIVYVGAIAILFLFIVMLLDLQKTQNQFRVSGFWYKAHIMGLFIIYYVILKSCLVGYYFSPEFLDEKKSLVHSTLNNFSEFSTMSVDINHQLAVFLYSTNGLLLLFLGLLLFLAMVLAIFLVKPRVRKFQRLL